MRPGVAAHILPSRGSCASQAPCFPSRGLPAVPLQIPPFQVRGVFGFLLPPRKWDLPLSATVRACYFHCERDDLAGGRVATLCAAQSQRWLVRGRPWGRRSSSVRDGGSGLSRAVGAPCTQGWKAEALPWSD